MSKATVVLLAAAVLGGVFLTGCAEKFTRMRYDSVYIGQSKEGVEATLGNTPYRFSDTWTYVHDEPHYRAVIKFDAEGKVSDKAWYDAKEFGTHPDSKAPPVPGGKSTTIVN
jgi:outer membrane protein assembly factor BamE (lipoprotein component of BamABCDE complex)